MIQATVKAFYSLIHGRSIAYNQVFHRRSIHADLVLRDLAKFCRAHESTFLPDARASAVLEGRREVWLRIQNHLNLSADELYDLHKVKEIGTNG